MSRMKEPIKGQCMCGAVRFTTTEDPVWTGYCHCRSCRKHCGGPVTMYLAFKRDQVHFTGDDRKLYQSSPEVRRGFCGTCGSTLTWEGAFEGYGPLIEIHVGALDDPDSLEPINHVHFEERIRWFDTDDALPRFPMGKAAGPSVEQG